MTWLFQPLLPGAAQVQAASGGYVLQPEAGVFASAGQPLEARRALRMQASEGVLALAGTSATFGGSRELTANAGAFAIGDQAAGIRVSWRIAADTGAFAVVGASIASSGAASPAARPTWGLALGIGV